MIDIQYAKIAFKKFLSNYEDMDKLGFNLKVIHTYHVVDIATKLSEKLNLSSDDINLAQLIALLHDIGRFEEITVLSRFDSKNFDHASYGVKMLFEGNIIRDFISDNSYDEIIKVAIENHNKLAIEPSLEDKCLLHSKIIRDADKIDNFRAKKEENIDVLFPGTIKNKDDIEKSLLSDAVYETVKINKCVDIKDRKTYLDYWVCVLAFIFDLNFKESYEIVKEYDYVNVLIDRFDYKDKETKNKMEDIRNILNTYVDNHIK